VAAQQIEQRLKSSNGTDAQAVAEALGVTSTRCRIPSDAALDVVARTLQPAGQATIANATET